MRIRIYQVNPERDASRSMFRSYDENRAINPNEYDNVFDADVGCENLEQIFSQFNTTFHPLFRGRSLSVSDVVELADKYGLTPRQKEVAVLLLAAKTRRQIAGELGLSESTVKMHTAELYRRLNINSRVELFRLFGVAEDADPVDLSENKISSISK